MSRRSILFLCSALFVVSTSCQKLDDTRPPASTGRGELPIEQAKFLDAVPAEYGDLIAVTPSGGNPAWSRAWFQGPDKSIAVVSINPGTGRILDKVTIIPRR